MKYIKSYKLYESNTEYTYPSTKEEIDEICESYGLEYTINDDMSVDIDGSVDLSSEGIKKIPIRFRNVTGNFNCSFNKLTDFEGCPIKVGGFFNGSNNQITTLKYFPKEIEDYIDIYNNDITDIDNDYLLSDDEWMELFFTCDWGNNPLYKLIFYIGTSLESEGSKHDSDMKPIYDRIREFDVIKNNKLDILSLESLFNFYDLNLDSNQIKKLGYRLLGDIEKSPYETVEISKGISLIMRTEYTKNAFYIEVNGKATKIDKSTYKNLLDSDWFTWQGNDDKYESK